MGLPARRPRAGRLSGFEANIPAAVMYEIVHQPTRSFVRQP
ncbi:MAG: hypothetical protein ACJ768_14530 [Gaiellaceae bacterium]